MNTPNRPNDNYQPGPQQAYDQPYPQQPGQPVPPAAGPGPYPQPPHGQPPYGQPGPGPQGPGPQGPQAQPYQQPVGAPPPQGHYQQGPAKPEHKVDTEINSMFKETIEWVKAFFTPDYTKAIDKARESNNQFSWAVVLVAYFLLLPFFETFVYIRIGIGFRLGFLSGFLGLVRGNLAAIAVFVILAGILTLSQIIFKEYKDWYRPLNCAAVVMIPRLIFLPVSAILRIIGFSFFLEIERILAAGIQAITIFVFLKFMYHNKDKKNAVWIMTGLLALAFVLLNFSQRIA